MKNYIRLIGCLIVLMSSPIALAANEHPAVCRIIVDEPMGHAFGSGTLIDARENYGLVITNWHVVRDATGLITVRFPNGFESEAKPVKLDETWDLAALVIWRPPAEPVRLAASAPQSGDLLTIHGYGQGRYRQAWGRCTSYYAPTVGMPKELVELDVEARQGDSGGPIFNSQGELAGVLFGAGQGTTLGSFGGRVDQFLATLGDGIGKGDSQNTMVASMSAKPLMPTYSPPAASTAQLISDNRPVDPFLVADMAAEQNRQKSEQPRVATRAKPIVPPSVWQSVLPTNITQPKTEPSMQVAAVPRMTKPTAAHSIESKAAKTKAVAPVPQSTSDVVPSLITSAQKNQPPVDGIDLKKEGQTILALFGIIAIVIGGLRGLTG